MMTKDITKKTNIEGKKATKPSKKEQPHDMSTPLKSYVNLNMIERINQLEKR